MEFAIRTHLLSKRYPGGQGIDRVSLQVPQGSIYGFLGPNGAGKTTTIRLLLGLLKPQSGSIELLGQPLRARPNVLARVGALVESPSLYPHLSGRQNLEITRRLLGCPESSIERVLGLTELSSNADRKVSEYSMGMRQRLGIALALIGAPELLILDEPTNGLDPAGIADLRRLLQDLSANQGMTVLVSSHLLGEVEQLATHLGVLHGGALRFQGSMEALRTRNSPRLGILCGDVAQALAWLHANGHPDAFLAETWITVIATSQQAPLLVHQLINARIEVLDMRLEQSSLETLFFELTTAEAVVA